MTGPKHERTEVSIEAPQTKNALDKGFVLPLKKATVDVANITLARDAYTAPQSIAEFLHGQQGQVLKILGGGFLTVVNGAKIKTNTAADKLLLADTVYTFTFIDGVFYEEEGGSGVGSGTPNGAVYASRKITADQVISNAAAAIGWAPAIALEAGKKYKFSAYIHYMNGTTTAIHALRVAYSGSLGAVADHESSYQAWGTTGAPTGPSATARVSTRAVNAAMIAVTGMWGNIGATTIIAAIQVDGVIYTGTAGNLTIEMISSAVNGLNLQAGTRIDVWDITDDV